MKNLLIVDDEIEIIQWLKELFIYECPLELDVYAVSSGKQAMALLNTIKFDVVLSDIKMPGMDGITLYKNIKLNWPYCRVVFLTGHREFDYIYEVIRDKEVRYILKTEGDEVILAAVTEAFKEIEELLERNVLEENRNKTFEMVKYLARKEYIEKILNNTLNEIVSQSYLDVLEIPIQLERPLLVFLGRLDVINLNENVANETAFYERFQSIVKYYMPSKFCTSVHMMDQRYLLILIQPTQGDSEAIWEYYFRNAVGALEYIQENSEKTLENSVSFSVSKEKIYVVSLAEQFEKLKRRIVCQIGTSHSAIIQEESDIKDQLITKGGGEINVLLAKASQLEVYLEYRKMGEYFQVLHGLCDVMNAYVSKHQNEALELYYSIAMVLLKFINTNGLSEQMAFKTGLYKLTRADEHESWKKASDYFVEVSQMVFELLGDESAQHTDKALSRVKKYILENLAEDLTLNKLADIGGFNASYLSRLFKQTYNCKISDYILNERIESAQKLLKEGKLKINEIAVKVGYLSPHSFTRTFRSAVGISPVEYRENNRNIYKM